MKYHSFSLFALLTLLLVIIPPISAQSTTECEAGFQLIAHDLGETCVPADVQRVVTIEHSITETVVTLGVQPVGVADLFWYNELVQLPAENAIDVGTRQEPNLEVITSLEPDLIIAASWRVSEVYDELSAIAPTITFEGSTNLEIMTDYFTTIATALNREEKAQQILDDMYQYFEDAGALLADADIDPQFVLSLTWYADNAAIFRLFTDNAFPVEILELVGFENTWDGEANPDGFTLVGIETLGDIETSNFFFVTDEESAPFYNESPIWNALPFVQAGTTYRLSDSLWLYGGPISAQRLVAAVLETLGVNVTVAAEDGLSIVDGTGTTLTFDSPPERIICLYTRCMELLAALEFAPVGTVTNAESFITDPEYFPQANEIALIEWDGDVPNIEQLIALQPDLVLGWAELIPLLEGIAPVYSVIDGQDSYQESHDEIRAFAKLLGREDVAEANITAALDRLQAYQTLAPGDVSVMDMFFYNDAGYYRDGQSGTCNLLKEIAICDWPDPENSPSWSPQVNDEGLLQLDPDVLVISSYGFEGMSEDEIRASLSDRPLWAELSAIQSGRVYLEPEGLNLDGMGTVGMSKTLDAFMPLLYPDVFPEALTDEQVQEILTETE